MMLRAACLLAVAMILPGVALGQEIDTKTIKVTASAWEQKAQGGSADFPPELTLDGNLDDESSWRADGKDQWIQYDLGAVKPLGSVRIACPAEDNRSYKFDIQVSTTGEEKDWTTVLEKTGSNPKNTRYKMFKLNGVKARYLRIVGRGNTSKESPNWIRIKEVMIIEGGPPAKPAPLPSNVTVQKDIEYVPGGGKSRTLDLYRPKSSEEALPLMVFIHGGGWRSGSKDGCPARYLAQHGYAVASINYRLTREATFPAAIEDCRAAIRFLRANSEKYRLQPDRVAVSGGSAGGHLAALVGTSAAVDFSGGPDATNIVGKVDESVRVQAVVDLYGASDLTLLMANEAWRDHGVSQAAIQMLGSSADDPELMKKSKWASPTTYVGRDTPPFLIQHGDADRVIPLEQARVMDAVLKKAGVETTLMVMPGAGHAGGAFFDEKNHETVVAFLDRHLKKASAAPGQETDKKTGESVTPTKAAEPTPLPAGAAVPAKAVETAPAAVGKPNSPSGDKFVHPGIYHNAADLAFMRKKIEARAEPWFSAFKAFQGSARANYTPHPVAEWDANKNAYMGGDAVAAYACALRWSLTGEPAYAAKAIEILNAWSSTLKSIQGTTNQQKLVCGWNGCHLANAAELLVHGAAPGAKPSGWSALDIERFKKMLGLMYNTMKDFQPTYNGNWDAAMMNSMMCIAVFCDDRAMFDRAVNHFHGKDQTALGDNSGGAVKVNKGHLTAYFAPSGQCQESARDQGHTQMGIGNYIALCEVAWKQGLDLYSDTDNRLLVGVEYTAKYLMGNEVPFDPAMPGSKGAISSQGRDKFSPIYEAVYQHYVYRKGLQMPFTKQIIFADEVSLVARRALGPYRPETMTPNAGICWGTLTMFKGAEDPQAAKH